MNFGFSRSEFLRSAAALVLGPAWQRSQSVITRDEALELAFPDAHEIKRHTAYLSSAEVARARTFAGEGVALETRVVTYYLALQSGHSVGVAYFDVHRVRTLSEVLMVAVGTDDRISRIEVLQFQEPPDYRPPERWLRRFRGSALDRQLSLKGSVANLTGATLTADAVTDSARRMLALHRVIRPF